MLTVPSVSLLGVIHRPLEDVPATLYTGRNDVLQCITDDLFLNRITFPLAAFFFFDAFVRLRRITSFFMNHFHQLADPRARRQDISSLARYAQNGSPMTWEARPHIRHNVDVRLLEHYFTNHKPLRRDQLGFLSDYVSCKLDPRANPSSVKILRKDGTA